MSATKKDKVYFAELRENPFNENKLSMMVKQTWLNDYNRVKFNNSFQDTFSEIATKEYVDVHESTRVAFIDVPVDWDEEMCEETLSHYPNSVIYQISSYEPILHDDDENWMATLETEEEIEQFLWDKRVKQARFIPDTDELYVHNGRIVYRAYFWSQIDSPDVENYDTNIPRTPADEINALTEAVIAKLNGEDPDGDDIIEEEENNSPLDQQIEPQVPKFKGGNKPASKATPKQTTKATGRKTVTRTTRGRK